MGILVVGAGAIGGYFGGRLLEAGRDVTFLARPRRAGEPARTGPSIRSRVGDVDLRTPPVISKDALAARFDLVLLPCKAYDLEGAVIKTQGKRVAQIISLRDQTDRTQYFLEPELVTNLFDSKREKRRIVHFNDIPRVMVEAVLSAEDKHFFQHAGIDPFGVLRAILVDVRDRRSTQGASTLTQQLARTLWLGPERGWRRKPARRDTSRRYL